MKAITRIILWFQLYALEIHIEGQTKILNWLNEINGDPITRGNMDISRSLSLIHISEPTRPY